MSDRAREDRFRRIFRSAHADHGACADDEWLMAPCRMAAGERAERALVWSRRNGPWRRVDVLWVGAAPGNAGGMGAGNMGAHATRIPFGGDIAGANLDLLLASAGLDRNSTYIVAALNQLPDRGGGEPRVAELRRPVGTLPSSVHLLRETILATGPRLVVALGNVGLRSTIAAARLAGPATRRTLTLPGLPELRAAGLERGRAAAWPATPAPDEPFQHEWAALNGPAPLPRVLWLLHPSAQNMSPHAGADTVFHARMVETRDALRGAVAGVLGDPGPNATTAAAARAAEAAGASGAGVYGLPEWRDAIGPRHRDLIRLWGQKAG